MMETPARDMVTLYVLMAMLPLMAFLGICGNALALVVYSQKNDKLTSTTFILALAVIDFFNCAVIIPFTTYMEYVEFKITSDFICKLYWFLQTFGIPLSALILAAIAVDRYFCICHPFVHAINQYRAKIIIVILAIVVFPFGIVGSLSYGVKYESVNKNITETELLQNGTSSFFVSKVYNTTTDSFCTIDYVLFSEQFAVMYRYVLLSVYFMSLAVVSILYLVIYRFVIRRRKCRFKHRTQGPRDNNNMRTQTVGLSSRKDEILIELSKGETPKLLDSATGSKTANVPPDGHFQNGASQKSSNTEEKCEDQDETNRLTSKETQSMVFRRETINRSLKDKMRLANLKTAGMLFVVSIIFFVSFLPSCLIALNAVDMNEVLFYLYFINYVCNPIIYAFMNQNFRNDLKVLLQRS